MSRALIVAWLIGVAWLGAAAADAPKPIRVQVVLEDKMLARRLKLDVKPRGSVESYLAARVAAELNQRLPLFAFSAEGESGLPVLQLRMGTFNALQFPDSAIKIRFASGDHPGTFIGDFVVLPDCRAGDYACATADLTGPWLESALRNIVEGGRKLDQIFSAYPIRHRVIHRRGWAFLELDVQSLGMIAGVHKAVFAAHAASAEPAYFFLCTHGAGHRIGPFVADLPASRDALCLNKNVQPEATAWDEFYLIRWYAP